MGVLRLKNEGFFPSIRQSGLQVVDVHAYRFIFPKVGELRYFHSTGGEELQAAGILSLRDDDEVMLFMEKLYLWA